MKPFAPVFSASLLRRAFPPCLRRQEAWQICRQAGISKRRFLAWCAAAPPLPAGLTFRHRPGSRRTNIYSREGLLWLAENNTPKND